MLKIRDVAPAGALALVMMASAGMASTDDSKGAADQQSASIASTSHCEIECKDPHSDCEESAKVIEALKVLEKAYSTGDLKTYEENLAEGCSTFEGNSTKLIAGKQAVLDNLKKTFAEHAPEGPSPLVHFTIDQPYAEVTGNTAVVSFIAIKETGGEHPLKLKAKCTDVFVKDKDSGKWMRLHFRGYWKKIS